MSSAAVGAAPVVTSPSGLMRTSAGMAASMRSGVQYDVTARCSAAVVAWSALATTASAVSMLGVPATAGAAAPPVTASANAASRVGAKGFLMPLLLDRHVVTSVTKRSTYSHKGVVYSFVGISQSRPSPNTGLNDHVHQANTQGTRRARFVMRQNAWWRDERWGAAACQVRKAHASPTLMATSLTHAPARDVNSPVAGRTAGGRAIGPPTPTGTARRCVTRTAGSATRKPSEVAATRKYMPNSQFTPVRDVAPGWTAGVSALNAPGPPVIGAVRNR